ncbi:MAG TPA: HyaD/HybD family hydrogenase maturation endopeptidase [Anaerohalosphaeraceae bacterium]|nr:HyaD/HybD family hydrogenase maturation endopeptidase [Anaerohalosphaeraceae bacterium]HOL89016.1 HyaD/HybD family hydrogenase maturation endopeptidase [Anaerohalosphaeraceae bacterium]HPP56467.1 HyaD/HybD family hydrogenase maturation endopeptidase [Anaerohalosphaeraceae bacterium]
MAEKPRTLILGIGNILLGDEGIGVRVIEHLRNCPLPDSVDILDGGTAGADLLDTLCRYERVILIDAIDGNYPPGTIVQMTPDELQPPNPSALSLHDLDLPQTLAMAKMLGQAPKEVIIIGIQPERIACTMELSPRLKRLLPDVAERVSSLVNQPR